MSERLVPRSATLVETQGAQAPTSAEVADNKYGRWKINPPGGSPLSSIYMAGNYDDIYRTIKRDWPPHTQIVWAPDASNGAATVSPEELHAPIAPPSPRGDFAPDPWDDNITYYRAGPYDIRDVIETFNLPYNLGAIAKYIFRAGRKPGNDTLLDLYKCREHIKREIARLERERARTT